MLKFFNNILRDERGVAGPIIAIAFSAIISSVGASVDYARAQMAQAKLADTLDAAGLAAGSIMSAHPEQVDDVAQNYFDVNFPQGYMDTTLSPLVITNNANNTAPVLIASATVPTIFMGIVGIDTMTINARTEIARKSGGLELILVMDNTGSMAGSKLTALKNSATQLVEILFGDQATKDDLWIGIVPFSHTVNIGTSHSSWLDSTHYATLNWGPTTWGGCVDARSNGLDQTDDTPTTQKFKAYFWADDSNNDWIDSRGRYRSITSSRGPNVYCPKAAMGMTNQKATILTSINAMVANGNTHVNLGAIWGWRMLSPKWRGLWGGTMNANDLPLDYGTENMTKVMILLTDGENTMSNSVRTAYGYLSENKLGTTSASAAVTQLNTRTTNICNSMKAAGIKIYTILYDLNSNSLETLFRNCASQPDYFFDSPDSATLENSFQQIGDSLSNLRISK